MKLRFIMTIQLLILIILFQLVNACYDPSNKYSIEVVFNLPEAKFNFTKFRYFKNYIVINKKTYIYRSIFDKNVVVILTYEKLSLYEDIRYPAIRVEPTISYIVKPCYIFHTVIKYGKKIDLNISKLTPYLSAKSWVVESYSTRCFENVCNVYLRLSKKLSTTNVTITLSITNKGNESLVGIYVKVVCESSCKSCIVKNVTEEVKQLLKILLPKNLIENLDVKYDQLKIVNPRPLISGKELVDVFEREVKLLIKLGVLKGVDEYVLDKLFNVIKPGYAGWNSRLVWYRGSWVPYYKLPNAVLLRSITCSVHYDVHKLPNESLVIPGPPIDEGVHVSTTYTFTNCLVISLVGLLIVVTILILRLRKRK